jgi:hypothetical protein
MALYPKRQYSSNLHLLKLNLLNLGIMLFVFVNDGYHYKGVFYNVILGVCVWEGDSSIHVAKPGGDTTGITMGGERYLAAGRCSRGRGERKSLALQRYSTSKGRENTTRDLYIERGLNSLITTGVVFCLRQRS